MKIEPIVELENSLTHDEYKQRKKMIKKRNEKFQVFLQVELDRRNMNEEPKQDKTFFTRI